MSKRQDKIAQLCDVEGESFDSMMSRCMMDSVNPGICMNDDCDYTTNVEPDCSNGYCEQCDTQTVKSFTELVL